MAKSNPIVETAGGTEPIVGDKGVDKIELLKTLQSYLAEAKEARKSGLNPRDEKWSKNLDLYWNRYDWSKKADWQAKETMPEVPTFVDRFAAALKEALIATPEGFYTVVDPADREGDMAQAVKNMTDVWLSTAGRNQVGQFLPFSAVFEEQMKMGALMTTSAVTTWKNEGQYGRVSVESVDPRFVWLDPTGRNLYRIRRTELDRHELNSLLASKDSKGQSIFDVTELGNMVSGIKDTDEQWKQERTGSGTNVTSARRPITLDEYIATAVDPDGKLLADRSLIVVANEQHIIRGPEANPFMHGRDWITYAPLVTAPLSVYGRSYMEDFGSVANTFNELTNMILDAVHTSAMKAFVIVPGMLLNPQQAAEGIHPNKTFLLEDGYDAKQFAEALELGKMPPEVVQVWTAIKNELREAASINEIGMGQFAPKGRTSATEVTETQSSSSALIRSIAQTVETRFLDPTLDLVWKTGLQHVSKNDKMIAAAAGPEMFAALLGQRKELIQRPLTFQARGITQLIQRGAMLKSLLNLLSVVAQSEVLLKAFMDKVDINKLVDRLFMLSNIDLSKLQTSQREQMIRQVTDPMSQMQLGGGQPGEAAQNEMGDVTKSLGIGK